MTFDGFKKFKEEFNKGHEGLVQAYKTLFLGGGATATPIGLDFKQMDFKVTQGAGRSAHRIRCRLPTHPGR